jgi:hypothetical protein
MTANSQLMHGPSTYLAAHQLLVRSNAIEDLAYEVQHADVEEACSYQGCIVKALNVV